MRCMRSCAVPWALQVEEMADSVTQDGSAGANCDSGSTILGISELHVRVV